MYDINNAKGYRHLSMIEIGETHKFRYRMQVKKLERINKQRTNELKPSLEV